MKNNLPQISLRTLMAAMVGLLVAIALAFAAIEYRDSYSDFRNAELMAERNRLAGTCLQAVDNFFAERGRGMVYLLGGAPITEQHRAFLDERRQDVDTLIGDALAQAGENGRAKAAEVRRIWEEIKDFRPFLDHALDRPQERRDPAVPGQWLAMSNELVVSLLGLTREMTEFPAVGDAGFQHLNQLRFSSILFPYHGGCRVEHLRREFPVRPCPELAGGHHASPDAQSVDDRLGKVLNVACMHQATSRSRRLPKKSGRPWWTTCARGRTKFCRLPNAGCFCAIRFQNCSAMYSCR